MTLTIRAAGVILTLIVLTGVSLAAPPGEWVSIRNETNRPLVVRELKNDGDALGRGRTLYPGEVGLERAGDGRRVLIYDPRRPDEPLFRGSLTVEMGRPTLAIREEGAKGAVVRLVPTSR